MGARVVIIAVLAIAGMAVGALFFPVKLAHIQLPAEPIAGFGSFAITNTMLTGWVSTALLVLLFSRATAAVKLVPGRFQAFIELPVEFLLNQCENVAGRDRGRRFFPLVATIFFFLLVSNWAGLLPGYGTLEVAEWHVPGYVAAQPEVVAAKEIAAAPAAKEGEHKEETAGAKKDAERATDEHAAPRKVPLLRAASSDLNTTLALALVSVAMTQVFGLSVLRGEYVRRFFNVRQGPIGFYVGILELISEFAKVVSFTFRLFGNIFAGEVLLAVIVFLVPWVVVLPFIGLELFVGLIQAFVFAVLTLVFMTMATTSHEHHEDDHHAGAHDHADVSRRVHHEPAHS